MREENDIKTMAIQCQLVIGVSYNGDTLIRCSTRDVSKEYDRTNIYRPVKLA